MIVETNMDNIQKQILENQMSIMSVLRRYSEEKNNMGHVGSLSSRMEKTRRILTDDDLTKLHKLSRSD